MYLISLPGRERENVTYVFYNEHGGCLGQNLSMKIVELTVDLHMERFISRGDDRLFPRKFVKEGRFLADVKWL